MVSPSTAQVAVVALFSYDPWLVLVYLAVVNFLVGVGTLGFGRVAGYPACNSTIMSYWRAGVFFGVSWAALAGLYALDKDKDGSSAPILFWLLGWGAMLLFLMCVVFARISGLSFPYRFCCLLILGLTRVVSYRGRKPTVSEVALAAVPVLLVNKKILQGHLFSSTALPHTSKEAASRNRSHVMEPASSAASMDSWVTSFVAVRNRLADCPPPHLNLYQRHC